MSANPFPIEYVFNMKLRIFNRSYLFFKAVASMTSSLKLRSDMERGKLLKILFGDKNS